MKIKRQILVGVSGVTALALSAMGAARAADPSLLVQGDYEFLNINDPAPNHNPILFRLAYGF